MGKTDGSRVLLLCLIFGLHHEEEAAGLGDEDEDFDHDVCHDACLDDDDSCIDDEYVHHEEEAAGLDDQDVCHDICHEEEDVCHKENSCIDNANGPSIGPKYAMYIFGLKMTPPPLELFRKFISSVGAARP